MRVGRQWVRLVFGALGWISGCGSGGSGEEDFGDLGGGLDAEGAGGVHEALGWSYAGEAGPERWGELGAAFAMCGSGEQQSPIDIPASISPGQLSGLRFDYAPGPATIVNDGHTVQVGLAEGANVLGIDGEAYSLMQFHFHAHSEHAIGGEHAALEMHLVHRSELGELAVVGVLFEAGAEHGALAQVFAGMSAASASPSALSVDIDPSELLPASLEGWTYSGSLTTPPCTEGVRWHLLSSRAQVSETQLGRYTALHALSRRPLMANSSPITSGN
jgi:carbonic anhydrase